MIPKYVEAVANDQQADKMMDEHFVQLQSAETYAKRRYHNDIMVYLYEKFPSLKKVWDFFDNVRSVVKRWAKKVKRLFGESPKERILWNAEPMPKDTNQFYLIELLDKDENLIWSKIGTTNRQTEARMIEHLRNKAYASNGVKYLVVNRVYDCADVPNDVVEDLFRSYYRFKYGGFIANDRFTAKKFDYDEADKIFENIVKNHKFYIDMNETL